MYNGKIGKKYSIQMDLKRRSNRLHGTLFNSFQNKKKVKGRVFNNEIFYVKEFDKGQETGSFLGRFFAPNKIMGVWTNSDGKSAFPFYLIKKNKYELESGKSSEKDKEITINNKLLKLEN